MAEACKASKECCQEKLIFAQLAFVESIDNTWKRILKHHSDLNLDFLDEDESDDEAPTEGAPAPKQRELGSKELPACRPLEPFLFFLVANVIIIGQSCKDDHFVKCLGSFLILSLK